MYANPGAVMLLDEPDAHLEILRQRQIYQLLCDVARENGNQVVAASHSEVLLNEAAGRDTVIAFVGQPHWIKDGHQVLKSLKDIGFDQYALATQTGWVLYLEGSTDLAILRALAARLNHADAVKVLERPFVHYVSDQPTSVSRHFFALREARPDLKGLALFDRLPGALTSNLGAKGMMWQKREIESYICFQETLLAYAEQTGVEQSEGPLFSSGESKRRVNAMQEVMSEMSKALTTLGKGSPWDGEMKVSDEFLHPLFRKYFERLDLPNVMDKKSFHELARFVPSGMIDSEIKDKLDAIVAVAASAKVEL
jgi:hypothetical protein